jgi:transcriptional regulator with XRE-family HTH domain
VTQFGRLVRTYRFKRGLSQNGLARLAGIDPVYVNRMERDPLGAPSRTVVLSLAGVLDMNDRETDRLLYAAGLAPETDWQSYAERVEAALEMVRGALAVLDTPTEQEEEE